MLKPGQSLFRQGDTSNGMFLVRKGTLRVYLEKDDGAQVELAKVSAGGMIGEMALFDQKPRSASVDASEPTEVTLISNQDFAKLVKQIPKWFTGLMSTLSGRLRTTNDRLEKLQAQSAPAMQGIKSVMRVLMVIDLLIHKDGEKEGKEWFLEKEPVLDILSVNFAEEPETISKILDAIQPIGLIIQKKNQYKKTCLVITSKGNITRFVTFLGHYLRDARTASLPDPALDLLKALHAFGDEQAYDTFSVSLEDLFPTAQRLGCATTSEWRDNVGFLANIDSDLVVSREGGNPTIKAKKKGLKEVVSNHSALASIDRALHGDAA